MEVLSNMQGAMREDQWVQLHVLHLSWVQYAFLLQVLRIDRQVSRPGGGWARKGSTLHEVPLNHR
jgi:hypothetical protein